MKRDLVRTEARDDAARLAGVFERLIRRRNVRNRLLPVSESTWTVTGSGQGFTAVDQTGAVAAGIARTTEAATELLAGLSTPPGATPRIQWAG